MQEKVHSNKVHSQNVYGHNKELRKFIKDTYKLSTLGLLYAISGSIGCSYGMPKENAKKLLMLEERNKFKGNILDKDISLVVGKDIAKVTKEAIQLIGGIKKYISRGDKVIIKPNIGWARLPEQAATTNPQVIKTLIELCYNAGASKVSVTDLPCNSADITFERTGIKEAVESVDGEVYYPKTNRIKEMKLEAPFYLPLEKKEISRWPMFLDFIEADKVINVPIAKHHNLSKLTVGMKNWYGAIAGRRNQLHQAIHESIASFAYHFRPHLTVVDGIRILLTNGPTGGSIKDTKVTNTIIASSNPVACDALASTKLFEKEVNTIPYIEMAHKLGLGEYDISKLNLLQKVL